jgi:hypothetical protein
VEKILPCIRKSALEIPSTFQPLVSTTAGLISNGVDTNVYSGEDGGIIMDAKLSCLVKGLIGVIFGSLALFLPGPTLNTFSKLFTVLVVVGIIICIFLAITAHSEGSLFWFLSATVLVIVFICQFIFSNLITIIFILAIAVLAFYSGLSGITLALARPRSKYYLIGGACVSAILLLIVIIRFAPFIIPNTDPNLTILSVLGDFSLVFGLFSILLGWYLKEEQVTPAAFSQPNPVHPPVEKK